MLATVNPKLKGKETVLQETDMDQPKGRYQFRGLPSTPLRASRPAFAQLYKSPQSSNIRSGKNQTSIVSIHATTKPVSQSILPKTTRHRVDLHNTNEFGSLHRDAQYNPASGHPPNPTPSALVGRPVPTRTRPIRRASQLGYLSTLWLQCRAYLQLSTQPERRSDCAISAAPDHDLF